MKTYRLASVLALAAAAGAALASTPPPGPSRLERIVRLTTEGDGGEPYFSFDGSRIIFQAKRDGRPYDQIYIMNADGSDQRLVSTGKGRSTCSYFLPDGKTFLYASTHGRTDEATSPPQGYGKGGRYDWSFDKAFDIYVADLSGKILKTLVSSPGYDAEATVSPRGDRIVFTSDRDGDLELYSMKLDGTDLKRLTHEKGYDGGAFYSPDGSRIVYRASRTDDYRALQVYVMNADGSGKRPLTQGGGTSFAPSWHPDGRRIVYCSNSHAPPDARGNFDLFLLDVDDAAASPVRLTDYDGFDGFPVFSPDGRRLAFSSNRDGDPYQTSIFLADFVDATGWTLDRRP
ncbi:MAG: TolB family protein [Candidatus Polarisedimenticolia bacterium]